MTSADTKKIGQLTLDLLCLICLLWGVPMAHAITNGQVVEADSPLSDFVVFTFSSNAETGEREACTGTLIDRQIVLTAAHCVVGVSGDDVNFVTFGAERGSIDSSTEVDKYVIHPEYKKDINSPADLALLHLAKPAPTKFRPIALASKSTISKLKNGMQVVLAGFGRSEIGYTPLDSTTDFSVSELKQLIKSGLIVCNDVKRKSHCQQRTSKPADGKLRFGLSAIERAPRNNSSFSIRPSSTGKSNILKGDSGGPALILENDKYVQVGLARQSTEIASDSSPSIYTSILPFESWIGKEKEKLLKN